MTSRERVDAVLKGERPDRIPNFNIIMGFSAVQGGAKCYRDYVTDHRVMCSASIACAERFGLDIVTVMSDPMHETADYGAEVVFPENGIPHTVHPPVTELARWREQIHTFNPRLGGRCLESVKAVRYYREHAADLYIAGWVEGAIAEACDLRGLDSFMIDLVDEDEQDIHGFLSAICEQAQDYALAQIEAGADIIGIGDAASSLISPQMFRDFAFPYQKRLVDFVHAHGARTKLHICGDTTKVFDQMVETGTDIIDVDWMVDLRRCRDLVGDRAIVLCGNYNPVAVLLQGTPSSIAKSVRECAQLFSGRYISSAGCEVPPSTAPENLLAVSSALADMA